MKTIDVNDIESTDNIILCNNHMLDEFEKNKYLTLNSIGDNSFVSGNGYDLLDLIENRLDDIIYGFGLDTYILKYSSINPSKLKEIHKIYDEDFKNNKCYTKENKIKAYDFFYTTIRNRKIIVSEDSIFRNTLFENMNLNNKNKDIYSYVYNRAINKEEVLDAILKDMNPNKNYINEDDTLLSIIKNNGVDVNVNLDNYKLVLNNDSEDAFDIINGLYDKSVNRDNYKLLGEFINYVNEKYKGVSLKLK